MPERWPQRQVRQRIAQPERMKPLMEPVPEPWQLRQVPQKLFPSIRCEIARILSQPSQRRVYRPFRQLLQTRRPSSSVCVSSYSRPQPLQSGSATWIP